MAYKQRKRKVKKNIPEGIAHIHATFNNTIVTLSDKDGNAIAWSSAGALGFRGSKKSTPYAAQMVADAAAKAALPTGIKSVDVFVNGPGSGREAAIRQLDSNGIKITSMMDTTPIPHNGCRPPKKRRV